MLKKDRNCLRCEKFFDCPGKPEDVKDCLNLIERKREDERMDKTVPKNH